jgi:radical SAM protein with 4Fe4S-binding SPASM domain
LGQASFFIFYSHSQKGGKAMGPYLSLKERFRPIQYDEFNILFDNQTGEEFFLDGDQLNLVLLFDGTRSIDDVLQEYESEAHANVISFLGNLRQMGALVESQNLSRHRFYPKRVTPYLESILFDITSLCNLQCRHCYVSAFYKEKQGSDLMFAQIEKVLDDLVEMNVRDVAITGGEPSLRNDIYDIISGIVDRNIRLGSFFTNGLKINNKLVTFIADLPQFTRVYISLDGLAPITHAVIRGESAFGLALVFNAAVKAIMMFVEAGVKVTVNTCLHDGNLFDLSKIYRFLKKLKVSQWRIAVPKPIGRYVETQNQLKPNWEVVLKAYSCLLDEHLSEVKVVDDDFEAPLEVELEMLFRTEMVSRAIKYYQPNEVACFYHRNRCSIKANGDVTPCGYFDYIVPGNVKKLSIHDIWLSDKMQKIKQMRLKEIVGCQECELLEICGTGCRAIAHRLTGTMIEKDEYACSQVLIFHSEILPKLLNKYGFQLTTIQNGYDFY